MKVFLSISLFVICIIGNCSSFAQQIPQFTQWSQHQFSINPAHAGIKPCIDIHSLYRLQWLGFNGAPRSGFLTLSAPIKTKRKQYLSARYGVGLRFENDRIGHFNTSRLNVAYAGHFNFSRDNRLSLGLYGGIIQTGYDPTGSITIDPDPQIHQEASFVSPDASFGAWWNGENYYVGLMAQNLIPNKWDIGLDSRYRFHTLLNAGYRLIINDRLTFLPAALIKLPPRGPMVIDIQNQVDFSNKFSFGLGYRTQDALLFFAGFKINQRFSFNYSFDLTLSPLKSVSSNTHEFSISFIACKPENSNQSACPLFE